MLLHSSMHMLHCTAKRKLQVSRVVPVAIYAVHLPLLENLFESVGLNNELPPYFLADNRGHFTVPQTDSSHIL